MRSQVVSAEDICLEEGLLANEEDDIDSDLPTKEVDHPPLDVAVTTGERL